MPGEGAVGQAACGEQVIQHPQPDRQAAQRQEKRSRFVAQMDKWQMGKLPFVHLPFVQSPGREEQRRRARQRQHPAGITHQEGQRRRRPRPNQGCGSPVLEILREEQQGEQGKKEKGRLAPQLGVDQQQALRAQENQPGEPGRQGRPAAQAVDGQPGQERAGCKEQRIQPAGRDQGVEPAQAAERQHPRVQGRKVRRIHQPIPLGDAHPIAPQQAARRGQVGIRIGPQARAGGGGIQRDQRGQQAEAGQREEQAGFRRTHQVHPNFHANFTPFLGRVLL